MKYTLYYVLNGLVDGQAGYPALTAGDGRKQADGHYFLPDDGSTDGRGPYRSIDIARKAADEWLLEWAEENGPWYYVVPESDGIPPYQVKQDEWSDEDVIMIRKVNTRSPGGSGTVSAYRVSSEGSYDVFELTTSTESHAAAAIAATAALRAL